MRKGTIVEYTDLREFPLTRYQHCYNVGLKMYDYAKKVFKWDENKCLEMFVLGNLHDIMYAFETPEYEHAEIISDVLRNNYNYSDELRKHSCYIEDNESIELRLLRFGDGTVDKYGNWVTFEERLEDVAKRHGEDSEYYDMTVKGIEKLKKLGFDDRLQLENK